MKQTADNTYLFRGNEERVSKLFNSLKVGVLLQGPDTEILFSNNSALNIFGLTEDELYRRTSFNPEWDVIHEDGTRFPNERHPVPTAILTKSPVSNVIMGVYRSITNDRVWLSVNAEPILDEYGQVIEVVCSFNDITENKSVEEKLTWLYQSLEVRALELATSNAYLERFLYVATHDLQEPLRLVNSFTQLLKKKYGTQLDDQANEYISYAVEGATRMKKLILGLLEYSKFSSNKEDFVQLDLNKVLQDVTRILMQEIRDTGADLIVPDLPVVTGNKSLITQLFENLISNALKYRGSSNPVIKIGCREDRENYLFSISDNGIGIESKYSDKIFVLFQRLHSSKEKYDGTGVGLAICKKIAELHNGNIWVESEQGKGSTFYFTISRKQGKRDEKV